MSELEELITEVRELRVLMLDIKGLLTDKYSYKNSNEFLTVKQVAHDLKVSAYYVRYYILDEIESIYPGGVKRTGRHFKVLAKALNKYKDKLGS